NDVRDVFRLEGDTAVTYEFSVGYPIKSLTLAPENLLFISTTQGLYLKEDTIISDVPLFKGIEVNQIKVNTDGIIWAATNKGVAYFDKDKWVWDQKFNSGVNSNITQIVTVSSDEIWFSTFGSGVVKWDKERHFFLNSANGLPNVFCTAIVRDLSGNIWIGTDGGGLVKYSGEQFLHYLKIDNPLFEAAMTISQDNAGNKWIGTFGKGIVIIDKNQKAREFVGNSQLPSNVIYSIAHLKDGRILVGSRDSDVVIIEKDKKRVKTFYTPENKTIFGAIVIKEDAKGRIWVGTARDGIYVISDQKVMSIQKEIPGQKIMTISIKNRDTVWVGTEDGGAFSLEYKQIDEYFNSSNPSNLKINYNQLPFTKKSLVCGIDYDMCGNLWVGTFAYGLFCVKPDGNILQYTTATGLLSNNIYSVLATKNGSVWFGTDRGVYQMLFMQQSEEPHIVAYGVEQGFEGLECNLNALFDDSNGCVWIGNIYGVSVFNPEAKHTYSTDVNLHLTNITTTNTVSSCYYPVLNQPTEGITLSYDNNNLIFSFKAIDTKLPSNVVYSFFMENLDDKWIKPSSTNTATYSFIPPGKYIFRVKATNGEGEWSNNEISIPIVVKPPFYQTAWFVALFILLLLLGIALYLRYRQLALIRRNKLLKELVESRTIELQIETMRVQQQGEKLRVQAKNLSMMNAELKKLSIVASKTDNAVLIANKDLEWEWANEGFTKTYGYTLDEYIDVHGRKILDSKSNKKIEHVIDDVLTNKRSVTYSNRTFNKAGKELWVQSTLTPVYDDKGKLQMIVIIEIDITHIKHINNELRKLSLVASKTDNAVIIMNKHGEIEWVNEGFHRMYEISLDEFKNIYRTTIFELHADADSLQRIKELYETDQTQSFVSKYVTSKGNEKWIQTVLTPIIISGHKYEQLIAV
ncbi:MAG TPA: two-component regulator propeller domain-containing protein, partial [Salinivirgaceae bacterium]|nr:two-component regulator propeller domain-containing protein [Salinivirgaceae bacterium]